MEQPSPAPAPQKQPLWRPAAMIAAAVGLGGTLLVLHNQPAPHQDTAQPKPQLQPKVAEQAIPMTEGALSLSMLPPDEAAQAIARSNFPTQQKTTLLAALKDNRIRLAAMLLADASGHTGQSVVVSGAGFSQYVVLGPQAKTVLLPIAQEGIVTLTRTGPTRLGPLSIAMLNIFNNVVVLPPLTQTSPSLAVPMIVQ
ncbi:hypothetical protein [Bombella intestini]|uniref:hypothetical protein n=1 Tax=Bombella intestini TaxID=1539051 RepID=UPI0009846CE7|nr:hypothetical protein [Bombella intestini]